MDSNYLKQLYELKEFGYFNGLEKSNVYQNLTSTYKAARNEVKLKMDTNADDYLLRYKTGVAQQNFIYAKFKFNAKNDDFFRDSRDFEYCRSNLNLLIHVIVHKFK